MEKEIILKYNGRNIEKIRIFGTIFVKNNKNNFTILINDEESKLTEYYYNKSNKEEVEIKLKINNEIKDVIGMFAECKYLLSASKVSIFKKGFVIILFVVK